MGMQEPQQDSYVVESEYCLIHQRQAEVIAAAKARGVKLRRQE
jgi:hypothetical protein